MNERVRNGVTIEFNWRGVEVNGTTVVSERSERPFTPHPLGLQISNRPELRGEGGVH